MQDEKKANRNCLRKKRMRWQNTFEYFEVIGFLIDFEFSFGTLLVCIYEMTCFTTKDYVEFRQILNIVLRIFFCTKHKKVVAIEYETIRSSNQK